MTDFFPSASTPLGGGLNLVDAPEVVAENQALELLNVRFSGQHRWTPRRAMAQIADIPGKVCGIHPMPHGLLPTAGTPLGTVYLIFVSGRVEVWAAGIDGKTVEQIGTLKGWENVSSRPKTIAAVIRQCLWIVDEGKAYGLTVYDPEETFDEGILFQPYFKFDEDHSAPASPIFARTVAAFANHLFVAGYGSEGDPDRPEMVRFSYLGLEPGDETLAGDAAEIANPEACFNANGEQVYCSGELEGEPIVEDDPLAPEPFVVVENGVKGLFDREDAFPAEARGKPVVGLIPAAERMVITTRYNAKVLFGYSRETFNHDPIDNQRGQVASRAGGEANGVAFWWSPLGPCFWAGGDVNPLERMVTPRLREADLDSMFFLHQREEYSARWYYSLGGGDPDRYLDFNYLYNQWSEGRLGFGVFCGGYVQPGTALKPAIPDEGSPSENLIAPANLTHVNITATEATAIWIPGETGPEIKTDVELLDLDGVWRPVAELDAGTGQWTHSGLTPDSNYQTRVRHRNPVSNEVSPWVSDPFTTLEGTIGENFLLAPEDWRVEFRQAFSVSNIVHVCIALWQDPNPSGVTPFPPAIEVECRHAEVDDLVLKVVGQGDNESLVLADDRRDGEPAGRDANGHGIFVDTFEEWRFRGRFFATIPAEEGEPGAFFNSFAGGWVKNVYSDWTDEIPAEFRRLT